MFFFFKQKTAYEISACLVGSEMCIRDSATGAIGWDRFIPLLENGFLFKVLVALVDTPIIYAVIYGLKGKIEIAHYDED